MIGAYQAINKLDDKGFDIDRDVRRLSLAAVVCGITLESDMFLSDSQTDKLTKLRNRMGLHSDYATRLLLQIQVPAILIIMNRKARIMAVIAERKNRLRNLMTSILSTTKRADTWKVIRMMLLKVKA